MPLLDVTARAHPDGHRIDLTWHRPGGGAADEGVRVVRRERTHPLGPDDGVAVADALGLTAAQDTALHGETTYYYALFAFAGASRTYEPPVLVSATATGRYDHAGLMYRMLPALYRRYDAVPAGGRVEPLRRFLELPGGELDQIYSALTAALALHDLDRVDGALLPLLAEWIGWRTDRSLPLGTRRSEIAHAPYLYRALGGAAAVESAVARVLGLPARTKEYLHNVARTTTPEQLTLWTAQRPDAQAPWTPPELLSVDAAPDGRVTSVRDAAGRESLLFHTRLPYGVEIRVKERPADGGWSASTPAVARLGVDKNPTAATQGDDLRLFWETGDAPDGPAGPPRWRIATAVRTGGAWSAPDLLRDDGVERRTPAAAADDAGGVWLFRRERTDGGWAVRYDRHDGTGRRPDPAATVPDPTGPGVPPVEDDLVVRLDPTHPQHPLWLFWAGRVAADPADEPAGGSRWRIGWRTKASLDPAVDDWTAAAVVPGVPGGHDREPAPLVTDTGVELFWASTRGGGWAVHSALLDATAEPAWGDAVVVAPSPYTQRCPLAVAAGDGSTWLAFRSNRSLVRATGLAGDPTAPRLLDARYAGTTTVRSGDAAKRALAGRFEDFQTYVHAGGRVARDVVGVFVRPPAGGPAVTAAAAARLTAVLPAFLPPTLRAVVVPDDPPTE